MTLANDPFALARYIDHSLLRPEATEADIEKLCSEAVQYRFFSVCIHPSFIRTARRALAGTDVRVSAVIGFPLGGSLPRVKAYEAMEAAFLGADELDIVMNIGYAKSARWTDLRKETDALLTATPAVVHKMIIETCYLTDSEKRTASAIMLDAGAEFVKTSTGFGPSGASVGDIALIRHATHGRIGIKAAGGIRNLDDTLAFIEAGATRIGTSAGVNIVRACSGRPSLFTENTLRD